jgi:hypothetical protein
MTLAGTVALSREGRDWVMTESSFRERLPVLPSVFMGFRFPPKAIVLGVR